MDLIKDADEANDLIPGSSDMPSKEFSDPLRHVQRSHDHRTKSVSELVESASQACEAIDAARNDPQLLGRVLSKLVEIKMIPAAEAATSDISKMSTVSKYRKIDERREVLLHPSIANRICSGITILYELSLLIDNMPGNEVVEKLSHGLETLDGPLKRKSVLELRERYAPKKPRKKTASKQTENKQLASEAGDAGGSTQGDGQSSLTVPEPAQAKRLRFLGKPITAMLWTPEGDDISRLLREVADGKIPTCLEYMDEMETDSALVLRGNLCPLLSLVTVMQSQTRLGIWAKACIEVQPSSPDISNSVVLLVLARGNIKLAPMTRKWGTEIDAASAASKMLLAVTGRKVHLFASKQTEGWESVLGDANWATASH